MDCAKLMKREDAVRTAILGVVLAALLAGGAALATSGSPQATLAQPQEVPVIKADIGPCSADIRVTDLSGKPLYNAKIHVQIRHGFLGLRKLDLEIGTNADGKARFEGLPEKAKKPLEFQVRYGDKSALVFDDPGLKCHASHAAVVQ
jgi:hypothetical protein